MAMIIDDLIVENTLDAPISATTQTALNAKYDASNPSNFQTAAQVSSSIAAVVNSAPAALDTLNELAAALGNDASFAANVTASIASKEPAITAGSATEYFRGDKTFQTLNKAAVGLPNVDDTSDVNKPVSTATQTALNTKYDTSNPADYQTGVQVSNSIDALIAGAPAGLNTLNELASAINNDVNFYSTVASDLALKAPIASPTFTGTVSGITSAMVGLGNVDDTADIDKPISTATQTALNLKYDASNPSGYQTAAQVTSTVSAASTTDRDRSNHTGTQLSATISDFASTVRSTILTGLSTATNAVIDATDTVLSALGKLQKQISDFTTSTNATLVTLDSRLDALELTDAQWNELIKTSADQLTNSNTTLTNVTDLQFTATAGKSYYLEYTLIFRTAATTTGLAVTIGTSSGAVGTIAAQVNIPIAADGTAALYTGNMTALGDLVIATGVQTAVTNNIATIRGVFICTTTGVIVPQFRSEVNGSNAAIALGSVALIREF